jgi:molybdopterin synthase sulfur carrier subunit
MRDAPPDLVTRLNVVYLARLREAFGVAAEPLQLPVGGCTVAHVLAELRARGGAWAAELAAGRAVRVAVNHAMATLDTPVRGGDELALFPPVTGG